MSIFKKIVMVLVLLTGLAVFAYSETLYSLSIGYYRLGEEFFNDDFGRTQNGANFNFSFQYFPENRSLGFLFRTSFGTLESGYEWKSDDMQALDSGRSASDLRLFVAPSYLFKLGSKVSLPLAAGPVFTMFWEESYRSWETENSYYYSKDFYYEALNLGIIVDAAIIITPFRRDVFFLKQGISLGCDFLHFERGEMSMEYRQTKNTRYQFTPYSSLVFSIYFGAGIKFN